ncbi:hypothetical protein BaRGS_00033001 [Batillaria attramentaria]|uniref:G-protein coupled receptors family 1 profile domain-containing protein n=1 Tax=Batillaria attramentaria TaxID=370345 RepID=A0ABD0JM60_9CAEN
MATYTTLPDFTYAAAFNATTNQSTSRDCVILLDIGFNPFDNPDNILSRQTSRTVDNIVHGIILPILFFTSTITNSLNMLVSYKHGLKERINVCIFVLALSDFIHILFVFLLFLGVNTFVTTTVGRRGILSDFFRKYHLLGLFGIRWFSEFLTTAIACERCLCVLSPLRSKTVLKTKTLLVVILVACPMVVGAYFVVGLRWSLECLSVAVVGNQSIAVVHMSKYYLNHQELVELVDGIIYGFVFPVVFIATVAITTILTAHKLSAMAAWRKRASTWGSAASISTRDVNLTRMLIGTSVVYIVCATPCIFRRFLILTVPDFSNVGRYRNVYRVVTIVEMLGSYVNSSVNFFVYVTLGSKFRETLRGILRCFPNLKRSMAASNEQTL